MKEQSKQEIIDEYKSILTKESYTTQDLIRERILRGKWIKFNHSHTINTKQCVVKH